MQNATDVSSGPFQGQPRLGIDISANDRDVILKFKICRARDAKPFVDRLLIRKVRPLDEAGTVCEFESEGEDDVLSDTWRYGEKRRGVGQCWPLTPGEYVAVAIGSGSGEVKFTLSKRSFSSAFAVRILEGGCV